MAFAKWAQISTLVHDLRAQGKCDLLVHTGDIRLGEPEDVATVDAMNHMRRRGWQVAGRLLPTSDIAPDAAIAIRSRYPSDEADLIIGQALADMVVDDYAQETPLGNLTADGIRGHAGV